MQKVKTFFQDAAKSFLPQPEYYHHLTRVHFSNTIKYFLKLLIFLNAIAIFHFILLVNPFTVNKTLTGIQKGLSKFPSNLLIDVKKGTLMTTFNQPYFLWLNYDNKTYLLAVVDETANPGKIEMYRSILLLTKKELVIGSTAQSETKIIPFSRLPSFMINSQRIASIQKTISTIDKLTLLFYIPFIVLLAILLYLGSVISSFLYLLIASGIVYIVFVFFLREKFGHDISRIHFRRVLLLSFHAATFPLFLDYLVTIPPPLFLLLLLLFVFGAVYEGYLEKKY